MRTVITFLHIPKTAGSTFISILRRNLRHGFLHVSHELLESPISGSNIEMWIRVNSHFRGLASHRLTLDQPFHLRDVKYRCICFVRDPIERIISEYFYLRKPGVVDALGWAKNARSAEEYLQRILEEPDRYVLGVDGQFRFITWNTSLGLDDIRSLISEEKLFLFPMERFDDACLFLETAYASLFRDTSYARVNTNSAKSTVSLSEDQTTRLRVAIMKDRALYDMASQNIEEKIAHVFPDKNHFACAKRGLVRRCRQRERFVKPIQTICERVNNWIQRW